MTKIHILTHLPDILLVELPEGAPIPYVINTGRPHLSWLDIDIDLTEIDLPPGTWQIVGMLPEVTEKQVAGMVKSIIRLGFFSGNLFKDYESDGFTFDTAIESLESAILADGYYLDKPPIKRTQFTNPDIWDSIQSRTLNPELTLILTKD